MVDVLEKRLDFKKAKLQRLMKERDLLKIVEADENVISQIAEYDLDIKIIKSDIAVIELKLIDLGVIL